MRNATLDVAGTKTRCRQGRSVFMTNATLEYEGDSFLLNAGNKLPNDTASYPTDGNPQIVGLLIPFTLNPLGPSARNLNVKRKLSNHESNSRNTRRPRQQVIPLTCFSTTVITLYTHTHRKSADFLALFCTLLRIDRICIFFNLLVSLHWVWNESLANAAANRHIVTAFHNRLV